ncbi:MAG TPA: UMP kinase, partial [Patescibacteria group bacterium]|nr:UMP kinase [Patescibacteria group bacterium]
MLKKKILFKLSGEFFKSATNTIDIERVFDLAKEIATIRKKYRLAVVFGGGNIFRGRQMTGKIKNQAAWHFVGMAATLVNALALKAVFDELRIPARIISAFDPPKKQDYFRHNEIIIFAGGTGRPFVTTDSAAVKYALEYG